MCIPALLSRKANAPVMMRISRDDESYIGRARTNMSGRVKAGFAKDGRITALDLFIVQDSGAYGPMGDHRSAGLAASIIYQPQAMRWRAVSILTNTPPRSQQRSPGPMQANGLIEPVITKAAKQLGVDQVEIRKINSPVGRATFGPPAGPNGQRARLTSAFIVEALERGKATFKWDERKAYSGQRRGAKVRGVGVAVGPHGAGSIGWDSLMTIRPDGALRAVGRRQPGHALVHRPGPRRRRCARDAVGKGRGRLGRHEQGRTVVVPLGGEPDDACDDARQLRGGQRREAQAAGDRGQRSRRLARRLRTG
jgi:CO/xanthine dehydrogenase Mo-binding subunit